MRKLFLIIFVSAISFQSIGFDGKRAGGQIALGGGLSAIQGKISNASELDSIVSAYSLRFGYGFNENFSIFFGKESHVYQYAGEDVLNEISALGVKLYLHPRFYLYAASGMGGFTNIIALDTSKVALGPGHYYGVGIQVFRHMSIEWGRSQIEVEQSDLDEKGIFAPYEQASQHFLVMFQLF
jgi:hypothetical protein